MIEVSATLGHLLTALLSTYNLRDLPVDVDLPDERRLTVTFLLSCPQSYLYRRRIKGFAAELHKYVNHLYAVDVKTRRASAWQTLI